MKNDHLPRQARDKHRFQTEQKMTAVVLLCRSGGASLDGKKRISVAPFYAKNDRFTKTGSNQPRENSKFYQDRLEPTKGKLKKRCVFLQVPVGWEDLEAAVDRSCCGNRHR